MKFSRIPYMTFIFILLINGVLSNHPQHTHAKDVSAQDDSSTKRRTYMVHVKEIPSTHPTMSHQQWHETFLPPNSSHGLLFSYQHSMRGFAAMLTEEEVEAMSKNEGFLHAHPSRNYQLHTTHSPEFLGLMRPPIGSNSVNIWGDTFGYGKGIIIGVLDSGIPSNHPSFDDSGMPPPPKKWKGSCEPPIVCNNKIIGAKSFIFDNPNGTPVDEDGHGTHTTSTAAGSFVNNASVLESAKGIASGIAPGAHLAIYKVCGNDGCSDASIQAGMNSAIADGVDVISYSIGETQKILYEDPMSIASFNAVNKGIFVSASAGNSGPVRSTVENTSPWIFIVGASTIDRRIPAIVTLSNGLQFQGESAYQPNNFTSSFLPLIQPQSENDENSTYCSNVSTLKAIGVEGKIVLCKAGIISRDVKGSNVKKAGGVGMIYIGSKNLGFLTKAFADVIPTSGINYIDGYEILKHYNNTSDLTATIEFLGTEIGGDYSTPAVASFSSRGPSMLTPGFVKPDVIGPGVDNLAAWQKSVGAFNVNPPFNIISGTSMSCPHLSGVAALLKWSHADWSPAMIKSAIITTSDTTNTVGRYITDEYNNQRANFHEMGSGHVNVIKANNPGLVYDTQPLKDYVAYLCGLGYPSKQVSTFVPNSNCSSQLNKAFDGLDLNYPSMVVELARSNDYYRRFSRVVTNVGPSFIYNIFEAPPTGVIVDVKPKTLMFKSIGEKLKFTVDVRLDTQSPEYSSFTEGFGGFTWVSSDEKITVRSSMVVTKK